MKYTEEGGVEMKKEKMGIESEELSFGGTGNIELPES